MDNALKGSPGPADYNIGSKTIEKKCNERALVSGSSFMSESIREPFGMYKKKMGPNDVVPYV